MSQVFEDTCRATIYGRNWMLSDCSSWESVMIVGSLANQIWTLHTDKRDILRIKTLTGESTCYSNYSQEIIVRDLRNYYTIHRKIEFSSIFYAIYKIVNNQFLVTLCISGTCEWFCNLVNLKNTLESEQNADPNQVYVPL